MDDDSVGQQLVEDAPEHQAAADRDDGLEEQYDKPAYKGKDAGDNYVDRLKDKTSGSAGAAGSVGSRLGQLTGKLTSFAGDNKKKLIIGGGGLLVALIPLILLIAFLLLFKLNDIEKLYIDYQFTKVDRAMGARAREMAEETKAAQSSKGLNNDDTTEVDPNAPLSEQIDDLNTTQINEIANDPSALSQTEGQMQDASLSDADLGAETDTEFGVDRDVPKIDDTDADGTTKTEAEMESEVKASDRAAVQTGTSVTGPLSDASNDIENEVKDGVDPDTALADNATKAASVFNATSKISTVALATTFYCITKDTYDQATAKGLTNTRINELVRLASRTFTAADAEKLGNLSLGQVGAYNNLFDSGGQSYTQSASYKRATDQPVNTDQGSSGFNPDLSPVAMPFGPANINGALAAIEGALNIPGGAGTCNVLLNPVTQVTEAVVENIGVAIGAIFSDGGDEAVSLSAREVLDETISQIGQSLVSKQFIKGGAKTLAYSEAISLISGSVASNSAAATTTGTEAPISRANKTDVGTDVLAQENARLMGGRKLSPAESQSDATKETTYENDHMSLADHLIDIGNPNSVGAMTLAAIPTNPATAFKQFGDYLATVFTPSFWSSAILGGGKAQADDATGDPYNIPQYGFTDAELSKYNMIDNANYVETHPEIAQKYSSCFQGGSGAFVDSAEGVNDALCNPPDPDGAENSDLLRYRIYLLDKHVVKDFAILYNKTPDTGGASTSAACTSGSCNVFLLGDSITVRAQSASPSVTSAFSSAGYTLTTDGSVGRSISGPGQSPATSGLDAVAADKAQISAAQVIIIELGTNYGDDQAQMLQLLSAIKADNSSAKIYWVNVGAMGYAASRPGSFASYNTENALINQMAGTSGYSVINWCNAVFGGGTSCNITGSPLNPSLLDPADGVHPSIPTGINTYIQLLVSSLQGTPS
jgi:hypothetical protein